jgi:hypothetical protein
MLILITTSLRAKQSGNCLCAQNPAARHSVRSAGGRRRSFRPADELVEARREHMWLVLQLGVNSGHCIGSIKPAAA